MAKIKRLLKWTASDKCLSVFKDKMFSFIILTQHFLMMIYKHTEFLLNELKTIKLNLKIAQFPIN